MYEALTGSAILIAGTLAVTFSSGEAVGHSAISASALAASPLTNGIELILMGAALA